VTSQLLNARSWAMNEFGSAELGDLRRTRALVAVAATLADGQGGTLSRAVLQLAPLKRAYRLFANTDVTGEAILDPHIQHTRSAQTVGGQWLYYEDSCSINYETHLAIEDMGWMGDERRGMTVHTSLAAQVNAWGEDGHPTVSLEGIARQEVWTRVGDPKCRGESKHERLKRPRESQRWAAVVEEMGRPVEGAQCTFLGDRESDIYETYTRCAGKGWDFIVRAKEDRALLGTKSSLFAAVAAAPVRGTRTIKLRAQSARPGREAVAAREVTLEIRATTVTPRPPNRPGVKLKPVTFQVVEAREVNAPVGIKPLHWILNTSWPCNTLEEIMKVLESYASRWLIEEYHKALKTGAGVEDIQLSTYARVKALFAVLAVVAVRLVNMKLLATTAPEAQVPHDAIAPEILKVLAVKGRKPKGEWTWRSLIVAIARLGGFLARRSDGMPGWITIWRGWRRLMDIVHGYLLCEENVGKG
jgi:hypothetical protein